MSPKSTSIVVLLLAAVLVCATGASAQGDEIVFLSTQFNVSEEAETFRALLADFDEAVVLVGAEEPTAVEKLRAEAALTTGTVDVVGALHGTFPTLMSQDVLFDLSGLLQSIEARHDIADAFVRLGRLGTVDYQYYIPWMQATYIMAAHVDALDYLPRSADINALTWEELARWSANISEATGENKLGFPMAGLWHRFVEGYLYPSFTGGMVTTFKSDAAIEMFEFFRDEVWPYVNAQSTSYEFMHTPLLSGEVWIAFDHTARLIQAFEAQPDNFVAFPAPAGPAGRGFIPVVVGLGVPANAPHPDDAVALVQFLLEPETQVTVLGELGFFPVVNDADTSDLPESIAAQARAVSAQASAPDAYPALLPVGLGDQSDAFNMIYRSAANRILIDGEDIASVLQDEGATLQALLDAAGAPCWLPDRPSDGACQVK